MHTKILLVENVSAAVAADDIRKLFAGAGTVENVELPVDRKTGQRWPYAFVHMATVEEAAAAVEAVNGKDCGGQAVSVKPYHVRREEKKGFGGGQAFSFGGKQHARTTPTFDRRSGRTKSSGRGR